MRVSFLTNLLGNEFSRIVNITFTTVALALAIRIRVIEQDNHIRGAVGSSPCVLLFSSFSFHEYGMLSYRVLAIIFAPLTLVHVMIAIYVNLVTTVLYVKLTLMSFSSSILDVL